MELIDLCQPNEKMYNMRPDQSMKALSSIWQMHLALMHF